MPDYKSNKMKNKMVPYSLPSTDGAVIHIPSRLGYGARNRIQQESSKVRIEQLATGEERMFQTVDPAAARRALLVESLLDPRTYHNMTVEGRPFRIDQRWIDEEMDEDDALYLESALMDTLGEQAGLVAEEETSESAEGEESGTQFGDGLTTNPSSVPENESEKKSKKSSPSTSKDEKLTLATTP